jgi:uncharacterized protein (DUF362 family)
MMGDLLTSQSVSVAVGAGRYDAPPPYCPAESYPEYPFGPSASERATGRAAGHATDHATERASERAPNESYALVRKALLLSGLDADHANTSAWNPLREIAKPGDTVVLKPNFVRDFRETHDGHDDCVTTHGSIIRAVIDYVYIALGGEGRIVIADAPHNDANFDALRRDASLDAIQSFYREMADFDLEVYDLRPERAKKIDGVIVGHVPLPGDPAGYTKVNLGLHSAFVEVNELCHLLYGSEYDMTELHRHQHDDVHEYLVSKTILSADCVISLPKLKTHKKVGLTVNMKNLVGINGNKNWLPHHREGTPNQGGDQFPDDKLIHRIERAAVARFKRTFPHLGPLRQMVAGPIKSIGNRVFGNTNTDTIRSGNWHGNDTTWRMVIDLNRVLHYADSDGVVHRSPVRKFFSLVDGVVSGEGNGPLDPVAKATGVVVAGGNPVAVDLVCARLMGFDYRRIPLLCRSLDGHDLPLAKFEQGDVLVRSNETKFDRRLDRIEGPCFAFQPHFGWKQQIEWSSEATGSRPSVGDGVMS